MKIPFKFRYLGDDNKAQDIAFDFPTDWSDLTFDQGRRIVTEWYPNDPDNVFLLLSILSGVEENVWLNSTGDLQEQIIPRLDFLSTIPDLEKIPFPKKMKIGDREIKLPQNLQLETWGQKNKLQGIINKHIATPNGPYVIIPWAVAVYAFPEYYGEPIDSKKLTTFFELIEKASFLDVYSAGKFFFRKSLNSSNGKRKT